MKNKKEKKTGISSISKSLRQGALLWFCCRFILVLCKNIKRNIINCGYWFKKLFFTIRPSFLAINVTHLFDIRSSY